MSTGIKREPTTGDLAAYLVGRRVSAQHVLPWVWDAGFLLGHNVQPIIAQKFLGSGTTSRTIKVSYQRNPGVSLLMVEVETHKGTALDATGTLTVSSSGGSIAWASGASAAFDGTADAFSAHSEVNTRRRRYRAFLNVIGLTIGTRYDLSFAFVNTTHHNGIAKLTILESPIATTDPVRDLTDIGSDAGGVYSGLPIASGDPETDPRGMARILRQRDRARNENRRQWQICEAVHDSFAFRTTSSTYANLMASPSYASRNPTWKFRARRVGRSTEFNVYELGFIYRVSGGGSASLRILLDGTPTEITGLTSSSYTEATTTLNVPCDTTPDQEVSLQIEGKTSAGEVFVPRARLNETEP